MAIEQISNKDIHPIKFPTDIHALYVEAGCPPETVIKELSRLQTGDGYQQRYKIMQIDSDYLPSTEGYLKRKLLRSEEEMLHRAVSFELSGEDSGTYIRIEAGQHYLSDVDGISVFTWCIGPQYIKHRSCGLEPYTIRLSPPASGSSVIYLKDQITFLKKLARKRHD